MTVPQLFVVAGEPSGDQLGGAVLRALQARRPVRLSGIGGPAMAEAGLSSLFPMSELSVMGLAEVLPKLPRLLRRLDQAVRAVEAEQPELLLTIDAPDFCFRLAQRLRRRGRVPATRLVHLVAPTVWAWRAGRARKIARFLDHLLVLLPFEPPWFEREGLPTSFIGHPLVESGAERGDGSGFRVRHGLATDQPLLLVLPGSRVGEVQRLAPAFATSAARLMAERQDLAVAIPTVPVVEPLVRTQLVPLLPRAPLVIAGTERFDAFAAGTVALAASGTVVQELALAGVPSVVGYRLNPLTAMVARRLIRVPHVTLINLIAGRTVIPEFLLEQCVPERLIPALGAFLDDPARRSDQQDGSRDALKALGLGGPSPASRAAEVLDRLLAECRPG